MGGVAMVYDPYTGQYVDPAMQQMMMQQQQMAIAQQQN